MPAFSSSQFISAAASGKDWREASKAVLEMLEQAKGHGRAFNLGFLYISDHLADDAVSILNLFKSVLGIDHWTGAVGLGVCGIDEAHLDRPAISAMLGRFEEEDFCVFPGAGGDHDKTLPLLENFMRKRPPMLVFTHGDPLADQDPALTIKALSEFTGGFVMGGLSSSRRQHVQFANDVCGGGLSGVAFARDITVATTLSQGCTPIGPIHAITRSEDHFIHEIDSKKAGAVFGDDLRSMAMKKIDKDANVIVTSEDMLRDPETIPGELKTLFRGEIHAAFPVSESDQNDYLVRNIIGIDPDEGTMAVSQDVSPGESIMFVQRDEKTVYEDLSASLIALRKRIQKETGRFEPKGALYVSCVARAFSTIENIPTPGEVKLIREVIGDVPLAGFYAGGEISNARLYGYTGVLTLFL
jgi:small ligand-binding sensory domain FIST